MSEKMLETTLAIFAIGCGLIILVVGGAFAVWSWGQALGGCS